MSVDLAELTAEAPRQAFDFGGLDMRITIERYPEQTNTLELALQTIRQHHPPTADKPTAYFVKATQTDGQMA